MEMLARLVGWLVGWLAGWLVGWLAGWLAEWLAGWWSAPRTRATMFRETKIPAKTTHVNALRIAKIQLDSFNLL